MSFFRFLQSLVGAVALCGLSLGMLLALALLVFGSVGGEIELDLELSRGDSPWLVALTPLVFILIAVISSPLSFLLSRIWRRSRGTAAPDQTTDPRP